MSKLITRSEFARLAEVSPAAIGKAIDTGRLKLRGIGRKAKIDIEHKLSREFLKDLNSQRKNKSKKKVIPRSKKKVVKKRLRDNRQRSRILMKIMKKRRMNLIKSKQKYLGNLLIQGLNLLHMMISKN